MFAKARVLQSFHNGFLLVLFALVVLPLGVSAQEIGAFQFVSGDVRVQRGGNAIPVTDKVPILRGDVVSTGADGQAQMRMIDDVYLALRPQSRLTFESYRVSKTGAEAGILSLATGILRTFTSALSPADRVKFRMKAQSATVGIRGSGNILAANDADGVINHTIEGAHSITARDLSGTERTLVSYPGQTVQVLPGTLPRFIPTPAFIVATATATTTPAKAEAKADAAPSEPANTATSSASAEPAPASTAATTTATSTAAASTTSTTVAPPVSVAATNTVVSTIVSAPSSANLPLVGLARFLSPFGTTGFIGGFQQGATTVGNVTLSTDGALMAANHVIFGTFIPGAGALPAGFTPVSLTDATVQYQGGTAADLARNREGSIWLGRWQGGNVVVTDLILGGTSTYSLGSRSVEWAVFSPTGFGYVMSLTGTTNYALDFANRPTDAFGNLGQLLSASASMNFTTRIFNASIQVAINNQTLTSTSSNQTLQAGQVTIPDGTVVIVCTGTNCSSTGYRGVMNANFAGPTASSLVIDYRISPNRVSGQAVADTISGSAALIAATAPTVGITLPQTGSVSLPLSTVTNVQSGNSPPTFSGTLSANFSNRTADLAIVAVGTDPTSPERHQFTATGIPIQGISFSASRGASYARPGDGTFTHTCTGTGCGPANIQGRFDGYFTNSQGTGAVVVAALVNTNPQPGDDTNTYAATFNFGTAPRSTNLVTGTTSPTSQSVTSNLRNMSAAIARWSRSGCGRCYIR
jgi:hypothetical protein